MLRILLGVLEQCRITMDLAVEEAIPNTIAPATVVTLVVVDRRTGELFAVPARRLLGSPLRGDDA
jgi:hypothetical protein